MSRGLNSSTKFTKTAKIRKYRNFRKIRSSCWALVVSGIKLKERGIFKLCVIVMICQIKFVEGLNESYELYDNCENY